MSTKNLLPPSPRSSIRWKPVCAVSGGMLVHLSLGTVYTFELQRRLLVYQCEVGRIFRRWWWSAVCIKKAVQTAFAYKGNLNPYLTSYMRHKGSAPNLTYTECSWVFALALMGQGSSMFLGGIMERKLGPRVTTLIGGWLMSLGVLLTYFSVQHSFALTLITYGLVFGLGVGIAYAVPLGCAVKWVPDKKGLMNGLIVAGFGGGAFIFNQVQTAWINPDNLKPDPKEIDGERYFTDPTMLDRVPYTFLILGGCYAVMQLIGSLLLSSPPEPREESKEDHQCKSLAADPTLVNALTARLEGESADIEVHPRQMLKSRYFYMLYFMFMLNGQGIVFISTLYKAYGQTFISDDNFLTWVGALAAVFNGVGRIFWGKLADRFSFRTSSMIMSSTFTVLMLTLQTSHYGGKALFLIYICLLFGTFSGSFSLFPTATAKCFGRKYMAINYGLLFTNSLITSPLGVFASQSLMSSLGWTGLFFLVAGCSFLSLLLVSSFNAKDKDGKQI